MTRKIIYRPFPYATHTATRYSEVPQAPVSSPHIIFANHFFEKINHKYLLLLKKYAAQNGEIENFRQKFSSEPKNRFF